MLSHRFLLPLSTLLMLPLSPFAQQHHVARHFIPGEWEIHSVSTQAGGRTVSSDTRICAKEQMDFWKVAQAGLSCKPAKNHPESSGKVRVEIHCVYDSGPLHSEIHHDVIQTYTDHGNSFSLTGTTTTDTVYQGVQPKQTSVRIEATAHRVGNCP